LIPVSLLVYQHDVGYMKYYFYLSIIVLGIFLYKLWRSYTTAEYHQLHIGLKILILLGVFSIVLISPDVLVNGKILLEEAL
jgi:4-hydroxybenzoate polyprenyltransferase